MNYRRVQDRHVRSSGNLALSASAAPARAPRRVPPARRVVTPLHGPEHNGRTVQHTKTIQRSLTRSRVMTCVGVLTLVVVFFGAFAMLLYRQSQIMEQQLQNTRLETEIRTLRQDRAMLEEEILRDLDLSHIRMEAIERLGMQEPGRNKIVHTDIQTSDLVVVNTTGAADSGNENMSRQLESVLGNLEGFFKKIR